MRRDTDRSAAPGRSYWFAWQTLAAVLVLLTPSTLSVREPFWLLSSDRQAQSAALAAAHALAAVGVGLRLASQPVFVWRDVLRVHALAMGLASMALILGGVDTSPAMFAIGFVGSLLLLALPAASSGHRALALAALALSCVLVVSAPRVNRALHLETLLGQLLRRSGSTAETNVAHTATYSISLTHYPQAVDRGVRGGGIERFGRDLLIATGSGAFYLLEWRDASSAMAATELKLGLPFDRRSFVEDMPLGVNSDNFRVAGFHVQEVAGIVRLWVLHHRWNREARCYVLRVSLAEAAAADIRAATRPLEWRTVYDTRPCLPIKQRYGPDGEAFPGHQSGGGMAAVNAEQILLTVGDHQFDGWNSPATYPQQEDADYGKTLLVHTSGAVTPFTSGHRNPQGLSRDLNGGLWLTEHGPQGGDELNLLEAGGNHGWPFQTFGTEYGQFVWPLQRKDPSDRPFVPPIHAWIPSIAPSNLIAVTGERFGRWRGDLLVGSLNNGHLYRIHLNGTRVIFVEPIRIGRDIRDLVETEDGRIVVWADDGAVVDLQPVVSTTDGAAVFARCVGCHRNDEKAGGLGPDLRGVVGRRVAGLGAFEYSDALRSAGGTWTRERLSAFLADPGAFAPGTTMPSQGIAEPDVRALIDYLSELK
jgi:aldose sugar dehydrogenase